MKRKYLFAIAVLMLEMTMAGCGEGKTQQIPTPTVTVAPTQEVTPTLSPTPEPTITPAATPTESVEPTIVPTKVPDSNIVDDPAPVAEKNSLAFSRYTGVYGEEFGLTMAASEETAEIFYTLDGSNPLTSTTAVKYVGSVAITKRDQDENVVSAVEPVRIAGSFNYTSKNTFKCEIDAPENSAVDKCTVVRAVAKFADGTVSEEMSAT